MSRYNPRHDIKAMLEAAQLWKNQCLLNDGPLLDDGQYWSTDNLVELDKRFTQNPQEGDESFIKKLQRQLADASPAAIKLMAELHWLLLLFSTNIKPATKRDLVSSIWEISGDSLPSSWLLDDATLSGAGSTGTGFNTLRWRELVFLIELIKAFKTLGPETQSQTLESPWSFADWLESIPDAGARQFRHIICFLLFPDSFEHTSVGNDKKEILRVLGDVPKTKLKTMSHREVDQRLLDLRTNLEDQEDEPVDFHTLPWVDQWRPSPRVWLMAWNPGNWEWNSFQDDRLRVARGENVTLPWRTSSKQLKEGDTAYLMRLGQKPKGLLARGTVASEPYEDDHYDPEKASQGEKSLYVDITLTDLRDPNAEASISLSDLESGTTDSQNWTPQGSGIEIKPRSAKLVNGLWNKLPPVKLVQTDKPTPRQQAINIGKPVNHIFYGPPGTGKTHHLRSHLQPKYESQAGNVTTGEWLEEQLSSTSWWETIALALADQVSKAAGTTVNDLLIHPFFKAKARVQGRTDSPHLRATCWASLQNHTVIESETVNVALEKRQSPLIFDKQHGGKWILTGDWDEAGDGLRDQLRKLQQGPQSQEARIKRHLTVTFHQSYSYEDFVEGIRPQTTDGGISYEVRDGLFKAFCNRARQDPKQRYALFIDEINRGNISRIFGELITLIEADKRAWWDEEGQLVDGMEITLPYSGERFGVPKNLDIYATMNTADRSIALMDAALRRRFRFIELMPEPKQITGNQGDGYIPDGEGGLLSLRDLLNAINLRLRYLLHRDQTFGHAYFMEVKDIDSLRHAMVYDIIPMLAEYFYDDWQQIRRVLADDTAPVEHQIITRKILDPGQLFAGAEVDLPEKPDFRVKQPGEITPDALRKIYDSLEMPS
ncbi:McrB family protein [Thalassolituus marinus]|uniref:AAA family ATPase n=1 Tax=Thalassolituus marinus TaxID=671053 RepID=A0ABS7ZPZ8_9GAMM|nr:AAA family ATPase [Thalassolituus marinus]MCA6063786.1 AAA family ATPase [Thalassolituus marinus]